ncbi:MAG: zinc-dependent metalloprotease family protein [Limisphaerales bacterium]
MFPIVAVAPSNTTIAVAAATILFHGGGGCYRNDDSAHSITVDITATSSTALSTTLGWVTSASSVLYAQTHVALVPGVTAVDESIGCNAGADEMLKGSSTTNGGIHILASDCVPYDVGGLAYEGGVCSNAYNRAIIFVKQATWVTLLHEIGHVLGGRHPFVNDDDKGTYGGVMDYWQNKVDGVVQFAPVQAQAICGNLQRATCRHTARVDVVPHTPCDVHTGHTSVGWGLVWLGIAVASAALIAAAAWLACADAPHVSTNFM